MNTIHRALICALLPAIAAPAAAQRGVESSIAAGRAAAHSEQNWRRTLAEGDDDDMYATTAHDAAKRCRAYLRSASGEAMPNYFIRTAHDQWEAMTVACHIYQNGVAEGRQAAAKP